MIREFTLLHLACFAVINTAIIALGYWLIKSTKITLGWLIAISSIAAIHFIFLNEHPIIRMLAIIATTFTAMKVIAVTQEYKGKSFALKFHQWTAFNTGWAGMRAKPFEALGNPARPNAWPMIRFGVIRIIAGCILIAIIHLAALLPLEHHLLYTILTIILLIALSLILHFGLLSISVGMWRLMGVNTYYLFKQPGKSISLNEFWSVRWNLAFIEMVALVVYRPLKNKTGKVVALMASFIFSGLLHELAISLPVRSGYGLPLLYFIIQGALILVEQQLKARNVQFLQNKVTAKLWVLVGLLLPLPLLFHAAFLKEIIWPIAGL